MPTRQRIKSYPTAEVQGEGSWVKATGVTLGEQLEADSILASFKNAKSKEDKAAAADANFQYGLDLLKVHVIKWNWVDDDGEPMPQMKDDPKAIELLTNEEITFLGRCIMGKEKPKDRKN